MDIPVSFLWNSPKNWDLTDRVCLISTTFPWRIPCDEDADLRAIYNDLSHPKCWFSAGSVPPKRPQHSGHRLRIYNRLARFTMNIQIPCYNDYKYQPGLFFQKNIFSTLPAEMIQFDEHIIIFLPNFYQKSNLRISFIIGELGGLPCRTWCACDIGGVLKQKTLRLGRPARKNRGATLDELMEWKNTFSEQVELYTQLGFFEGPSISSTG